MEDVVERGGGRGRVKIRGGGRVRGRAIRGGHSQIRQYISNEIRATLVDHVINHGLTLREAGQRVQPPTLSHLFFSFLFCEHIFVHSNVNISAVHMLHGLMW